MTIGIFISYGVHSALSIDFPFTLLTPIVGAMGLGVVATITLWLQRKQLDL